MRLPLDNPPDPYTVFGVTNEQAGYPYWLDGYHTGIDYAVIGGTPVYAMMGGVIKRVGDFGGKGLVVEINHGGGLLSRYCHLSRAYVHAGWEVAEGRELGLSGNTGFTTGPHLHWEVLRNGVYIDPMSLFVDEGVELDQRILDHLDHLWGEAQQLRREDYTFTAGRIEERIIAIKKELGYE